MKVCTKCSKNKPFSAFYIDRTRKGGLQPRCKVCDNKRHKKYYQAHKTESLERCKKYHKTIIGHLHHCFRDMKRRCNNPQSKAYKYYGGRGIKIKFKNVDEFVDYVVNELQADGRGLDIDRINNNGHYEKGNIHFITHSENLKNRKR